MTPDQIYQILLGLVTLFGGIWIRRLQSDIRDLEEAVERIKDEYQRREDARAITADIGQHPRYQELG
jgi:hypothetical protein